MSDLTVQSPAKINLGLLIKGRRPDGYHLLETLFLPIELHDTLTFTRSSQAGIRLRMEGMDEEVPMEKNLAWKAWNALNIHTGGLPGVDIRIDKRIPAGAGLGGGSSNAANVLSGLNRLFAIGLDVQELSRLAAPLGADVPFFLHQRPMLGTGTGADLEDFPFTLPGTLRLITPPIHSSTADAYRGLDLSRCNPDRSLRQMLAQPPAKWKDELVNDLEVPVFARYPQLKVIKEELYRDGAIYAAMTGSGSAMFGIFP